ncbi:MAG TPA: 6-carboxytetrahydropterin synthase QueD [Dissulfurispiraceae bacterium]|nr:6-carboxytetrahydropterin synthase QueD [Dissulfurispiraceae bacterium]
MYTLSIETKFASAHQLREYNGKCENLHGHNWKVQVVVSSRSLNKIGIAIDFTDLRRVANEVIGSLDHICLNDLPQFADVNPSSENISRWIFESLKENFAAYNVTLKSITVWESETAAATYSEE